MVAHNVAAAARGAPPRRYRYSSRTAFVNLGRYKAVGRIGPFTFRGFLAWWMARSYHLSQIPGLFRKVRAVIDWTVSLPFSRDTAEVGSIGHPRPLMAEVYEAGGTHRPLSIETRAGRGRGPVTRPAGYRTVRCAFMPCSSCSRRSHHRYTRRS